MTAPDRDAAATRAYYESLPGKRIGAGLVCRDGDGRLLLVRPTYKPMWEVPGGTVEAGESPADAVTREVGEELGVALPVGRLLVVDWLPVRPPKTEGLMLLFDGGVLTDSVTDRFQLPSDELSDWRFFSTDELDAVLPEHMVRRLHVALNLAMNAGAVYLEHGHRVEAAENRDRSAPLTLVLMRGPPGTGKSTIARKIGRRLGWPVIDKDVFRDLLPDELGGLSYQAMLDLAERQLAIGLSVIADSPLGYGHGYAKAKRIAERTGASVLVLACECSDREEWERRLERRRGGGMAAHHTVDASGVKAFERRSADDPYEVDVPMLVLDTREPLERSVDDVIQWVDAQRTHRE